MFSLRMPWPSSSMRLPLYHALDAEEEGWLPATKKRSPRLVLVLVLFAITTISLLAIVYRLGEHAAFASIHPDSPSSLSPIHPLTELRDPFSSSLSSSILADKAARISTRWAPVAISTCESNTPTYYAPCLAERRESAVYGEELIYPDFRLREPVFAPSRIEVDAPKWRELVDEIRERASLCVEHGWVCYRGQHGQNIVLANATYNGNPPHDTWSNRACMSDGVTTEGFLTSPTNASSNLLHTQAEYDDAFPTDTLLVASSPDSWSFQHFLDRVTHIIAQGTHLISAQANATIVTGAPPGDNVAEWWKMLGWESGRIHNGLRTAAKTVIFSCRAPLVHPWLSLRTLETLGVAQADVPLENRKMIVYCSRSHGHIANGGRKVRNEEDLLENIRTMLEERNEGEELVLFNEDDFLSQSDLVAWFHQNVRAVIGPHGGALFHHRWTGSDTLILEMMPTTFTSLMFWEEASILDQVYATTILPSAGGTDMLADVPAVLDILRENLGKPGSRGPSIKEMYRWSAPELQIPSR